VARVSFRGAFRILLTASVVCAGALTPAAAYAQRAPAVVRAQSLRDAGDLRQAVQVLREHLAAHPEDGDAARLLAQTLYWLKDLDAARREYEDALRRHPDDTTLRVQYARMLVETGSFPRATEVLAVLPENPGARSDAETILGLIAYWQNDRSTARRRFSEALGLNPSNREARQHLAEIGDATAPWIGASASVWHDDQPLDHADFGIEAGWFPSPDTSVAIRAAPARFQTDVSTTTISTIGAAMKSYVPSARTDVELAFGASTGAAVSADTRNWTGLAGAAIHASSGIRVGGRVSRTRYLYTAASADTPVMVNAASGYIRLDRAGWLGEANVERQQYPDDNSIRTAYAWLLAPIARRPLGLAQIGYAISSSTAAQSRFTLRNALHGAYVPYYTPDDVVTQSVAVAVSAGSSRASFHGSASYGFKAHDNEPSFALVNRVATRLTAPRSFTPWTARASLSIAAGRATIEPAVEAGKTVFYSWTTAGLDVRWRMRKQQ
jgi:Tfp pilus assembly protein PilF